MASISAALRLTVQRYCTIGLILCCVLSVILGQAGAPQHFTRTGKGRDTETAYLRASVALGDRYLIENVFHESLRSQYSLIFGPYLHKEQLRARLEDMMSRSPQSPAVLWVLAEVLEREGEQRLAETYRAQARMIDPLIDTRSP